MRIWTYKELRENTTDELLDILSDYLYLRKDVNNLIDKDKESELFYDKEHLVNYEMNIRKIENELSVRSKNNLN